MRALALSTLVVFLIGCAHFGEPPRTEMVAVPEAVVPPPSRVRPPTDPETENRLRRRSILATGLALLGVGAVFCIGGGVELSKPSDGNLGDDIGAQVMGRGLLGLGGAHVGAGLALTLAYIAMGSK